MKKINGRLSGVRFVKASKTVSSLSAGPNSGRSVMNSAIKLPQPSLQSESYRGPVRKHNTKAMKIVSHFAKTAAADIRQSIPTFYHPDFEPSSLILPKDRIEINSWCNYFYKYDALVSTAIDMHSELPLSKIRLDLPKTQNKKTANRILEHYVDMIGNTGVDLFNKLLMFGIEYHKIGNVFPWAQMKPDGTGWSKLTCLNPDYIHIEKLGITNAMKISLVPDDRLRHVVHAGPDDEKTGELFKTLSEQVIECVNYGKEIPLSVDPNEGSHVSHLARKLADYNDWGTSIIERNFKSLVYKDRLRQSQDAIATRHLTPKHLIWADYTSRADVNEIREQVEDAMLNPDSAIITNYELHWELIGTSSGLMQLATEREWITEDLLIGLMINKNVLLGEGNFAAGQTVLEVLNQRYAIFREILEAYIEKNLFIPVARNMGFVEYEPGTAKHGKKEVYLYPKVRWNRLNLTDDTQHKQMLGQAVSEGKVDIGTWLEHMGLNSDSIAERLKANEDTVFDPAYNELRRSVMMEVGRSLGPAVAKVYAEAYGLELDDQGGMGMFGKSTVPITKFGKNFDINYGKDGELIIKPIMEIVEYPLAQTDEKKNNPIELTAESRDQRRHEREVNRSKRMTERSKKKLEISDNQHLKPPRKDLKKLPQIFNVAMLADKQFNITANEDDDVDVTSIPVSMKSASEIGATGTYDSLSVVQSLDKVSESLSKIESITESQSIYSDDLKKQGADQFTRQLTKDAENEIVNTYYSLINRVANQNLNDNVRKRIHQMYAAVYHCMINPQEPIFTSTQNIKNLFAEDVANKTASLIQKIELISSANRKIAQKTSSADDIASQSRRIFSTNENSIRKAFRQIVAEIIQNVKQLIEG
ncbi:MAG: hypothetical protein Q7R33_05155 [Nitrosarchaeum sp.]|nr:hypothetical protein [Nitrosarchaeum sp.]